MPFPRRIFAFSVSALVVGICACGSRTGLFGPERDDSDTQPVDASVVDVVSPPDVHQPDATVPCIPGRFDFVVATAQLMFVVDRSGSMDTTLDGREDPPPGQSRWEILQNGLSQALTGFDQQIAMGAKFYPSTRLAFECVVEQGIDVEPKLGNAAAILKVFDDTGPYGGTPTADALKIAADHVSTIRGVARTLVVATDGAPNCNYDHPTAPCTCTASDPTACDGTDPSLCLDDTRTIDTVRAIAEQQKVPVYVIGIGSTESSVFRNVLDEMAIAGGRAKPTSPRYYSAQTSSELDDALSSIRDSVGSCTFLTPSAPTDPNAIVVQIAGVTIPRDTTRTEGWDWVDQAYGTLALFGDACKKVQSTHDTVSGVVRCN